MLRFFQAHEIWVYILLLIFFISRVSFLFPRFLLFSLALFSSSLQPVCLSFSFFNIFLIAPFVCDKLNKILYTQTHTYKFFSFGCFFFSFASIIYALEMTNRQSNKRSTEPFLRFFLPFISSSLLLCSGEIYPWSHVLLIRHVCTCFMSVLYCHICACLFPLLFQLLSFQFARLLTQFSITLYTVHIFSMYLFIFTTLSHGIFLIHACIHIPHDSLSIIFFSQLLPLFVVWIKKKRW